VKEITFREVEFLAFNLAQEMLAFNEPIPDFSTRFAGALESCLAVPFQKFAGKSPYPTLVAKAAMLFYLMIKNHPFQNGNKRIAMTTLTVFLFKNKKWLNVDSKEFYNLTVWVAQSPPAVKKETAAAIETFLKKYITNLREQ
jgi:death-on-curing family protein